MAHHQLAHRHERKAQGSFCCGPRAGCRRTAAADQGQGSATSARRRGLVDWRTQDVGREESKAGKKESTGRRRDRHCPPCARPSSNSSLDHRHSDARAAENGFAAKSSVNKSAKVVLIFGGDCGGLSKSTTSRNRLRPRAMSVY